MAGTARNEASFVIQASGANGDITSPDFMNVAHRGLRLTVNITAGATAAVKPTFTIQGKVNGTTSYHSLMSAQATTTVQVFKMILFPGASTLGTTGYGKVKNDFLPTVWRFKSTNLGAGAVGLATWSASVDLMA